MTCITHVIHNNQSIYVGTFRNFSWYVYIFCHAHEFAIVFGPARSDSIFRRAAFRKWGPGISSKAKSNGQNVLFAR